MLKITIEGPQGSGKSLVAMQIADGLRCSDYKRAVRLTDEGESTLYLQRDGEREASIHITVLPNAATPRPLHMYLGAEA